MKLKIAIPFLIILMVLLAGCEVIGGIFKAGVWTGILLVALVLGAIIFIIAKMSKGGK